MNEHLLRSRTYYVFVDFHETNLPNILLKNRIVAIFDHHKTSEPCPYPQEAVVHIQLVGSSASIVTEYIKNLKNKQRVEVSMQIFELLHAPIYLDTSNFEDEEVTKDLDKEMCAYIEGRLASERDIYTSIEDVKVKRKALYAVLVEVRSYIDDLDSLQILKKDWKRVYVENGLVQIGISCFPTTIEVSYYNYNLC